MSLSRKQRVRCFLLPLFIYAALGGSRWPCSHDGKRILDGGLRVWNIPSVNPSAPNCHVQFMRPWPVPVRRLGPWECGPVYSELPSRRSQSEALGTHLVGETPFRRYGRALPPRIPPHPLVPKLQLGHALVLEAPASPPSHRHRSQPNIGSAPEAAILKSVVPIPGLGITLR